ncbi:Cyclin-dependent kinase 20 [Halotydeus destructor]|nr:Cyclin-dependent kinase 20 [Halotydeus destructor]
MERYKCLGHINAGAHGVILKAIKLTNGVCNYDDFFAIKRLYVRSQEKEIPLNLVREIKSLQLLNGEHYIIPLLDVFSSGLNVNLVFPLLPMNLTALIYETHLTTYQRLACCWMLIRGVDHCHSNQIVHRDLKPANVLVDWNGHLKICDFGQARLIVNHQSNSSDSYLSHQVCTRWYRAPELLYGSNHYGFAVDMWSVGCIVAEMYLKRPLFKGESDIEQLCLVVNSLGSPPPNWSETMPDFNKISFNVDSVDSEKWLVDLELAAEVQNLVSKLCTYIDRQSANQCLSDNMYSSIADNGLNESKLFKPTNDNQLERPPNQP